LAKAHKLALEGDGLDRWNACVILCLTEPIDQIAECVTGGLEDDPRPEIRAFYLEQLLEHADEYQYNTGMIEELWDRETDSTCRSLYKDLFRIAALLDPMSTTFKRASFNACPEVSLTLVGCHA
jgi:hypothetical protein